MKFSADDLLSSVKQKNQNEPEFIQAVEEVVLSLENFLNENPIYVDNKILERLIEPDRTIIFRVPWIDDAGEIKINRGFRVQFNNAIGPYKGGLRFHPSVNLSILKFLGFEQAFKNSLTGLPLGAGKGGSDFDPHGKSDHEVMRFTQSFMTELYRHIGPNIDVPAGDIGVGAREIGYLYGQYKRLTRDFSGTLTGKGLAWGGSNIRTEATGYGVAYFAEEMLNNTNDHLLGKNILISGSGNVAQYTAEKAIQLGAKVLTLSDSNGTIYIKDGLSQEQLDYVKQVKNIEHDRIQKVADKYNLEYLVDKKPWSIKADAAFPCATQNEITVEDAQMLIDNGTKLIVEGANMPSTAQAVEIFRKNKILFSPGKASNAGGVAVSGLEMSQNSLRLSWTRSEVDERLKVIMKEIHQQTVRYGKNDNGYIDYVVGANIAGFKRLADSILAQGLV
jgi:glutamate dehydrogenase/leucine dehydrogenase